MVYEKQKNSILYEKRYESVLLFGVGVGVLSVNMNIFVFILLGTQANESNYAL